MSNFEGPLSSQPEWQGHYSYLPPGEPNLFAQPFQQVSGSSGNNTAGAAARASTSVNAVIDSPGRSGPTASSPGSQSHLADTLKAPKIESPVNEAPESELRVNGIKTEHVQEEPSVPADPVGPATLGALAATSSAHPSQENSQGQSGSDDVVPGKEEDDDLVDDDDMLDIEGDGEGEASNRPMTAAERTAARRKMKRFR
jgi:hypothetical protein